MKSVETQLNEALEQNTILKRVIHQQHLLRAQVELEERIAALPTDAKERLRKAFPGTDLAGLKQAIKVEQRR